MTSLPTLRAERLRVTMLSAPLEDTVPMSFSSLSDRRACLVEIEADGLIGIGESWVNYPAWAGRERLATLCEGVAPLVVGQDVADPSVVQQHLLDRLLAVGRQWGAPGPIWQAISAVDLALWDLRGKATGLSVAQLLINGAAETRDRVPAYASGVGPTDVARLCESAARMGLTAVKTKIGFGRSRDRATLDAAREALGASTALFADANQAWTLQEARDMCEILSGYDVALLEEPLAGDGLDDLEKLAAEALIPLATGENIYGVDTFDRYVGSTAIHTIQPDLCKSGGFTVGAQVAHMAARERRAIAPHCYSSAIALAASLQYAAAYPHVDWLELDVRDNPLRSELLTSPLQCDNGDLVVPEGPGLGIELDTTTAHRYQTHVEERTHHDL